MKVHRISRLVAIGLATAAVAAPAASARPVTDPPIDQGNASQIAIDPAPAPVVQSADQGFDWGSAAIGAGVASGLLLLGSFGGVTYRHRHDHGHIGVAH